jgi:WD40 repeat protein
VSGSVDGSIKIWDAVSNRCIATFLQAHDGDEVCSVTFSRNGKYVLSSGKVMINEKSGFGLTCFYYFFIISYFLNSCNELDA